MAGGSETDGGGLSGVVLMAEPAIAVNLLWCVPGRVGGSEEYLVRQLLGLVACGDADGGDAPPAWRPLVYAPAGFAAAHPDLAAICDVREAPLDGVSRLRRVAAEATWLRGR